MKRLIVAAALALGTQAVAGDGVKEAKALNEVFVAAGSVADVPEAVKQVAALFTDDMHHIGLFGQVNSKAQLVQIITQGFAVPNRKVELLTNEGTALDKDTVLTVAKLKYSFTAPDGKDVVLPLRCTRVVKKQADGKYLIAAEHTSVGVPPPPPPPAPAKK